MWFIRFLEWAIGNPIECQRCHKIVKGKDVTLLKKTGGESYGVCQSCLRDIHCIWQYRKK